MTLGQSTSDGGEEKPTLELFMIPLGTEDSSSSSFSQLLLTFSMIQE